MSEDKKETPKPEAPKPDTRLNSTVIKDNRDK